MKKNYILYLPLICLLINCGQSKEEKELQKVKQELSQVKTQMAEKEETKALEIERRKKEKLHQQKLNVGKKKRISVLNDEIERAQNALKEAKINLSEIREFQIGRSSDTKARQIRSAKEKINQLERYIQKFKAQIAELELDKTFEFQKSPEKLIKYIFQSAKEDNFANFRYLCDPYAENDTDVRAICFCNLMNAEGKEELRKRIMNGRIMGETNFKNNIAEIEIAIGENSSQLEKVHLIERNDYWYLYSL